MRSRISSAAAISPERNMPLATASTEAPWIVVAVIVPTPRCAGIARVEGVGCEHVAAVEDKPHGGRAVEQHQPARGHERDGAALPRRDLHVHEPRQLIDEPVALV